jgi:5'-deoxy-5'-methylthioadenosine phosphorylase
VHAVIGGSGLYGLNQEFRIDRSHLQDTPYGQVSAELKIGELNGQRIVFLPRHGESHQIPPHRINYRANLWALQHLGVQSIIAVNAVGGIDVPPRSLVIPDQIIDYTANREVTFFDGDQRAAGHIDFTYPYNKVLRERIIAAAQSSGIELTLSGTYGCTNGPRFETGAEIQKMQRDGCNIIGMTGMPEACLARELDMDYASIALVVNWCAGIEDSILDMEQITRTLERGMKTVIRLIDTLLATSDR